MLAFVLAAAAFPAASSFLAYMERAGGREEGRMEGERESEGGRGRERKREKREKREREEREREREEGERVKSERATQ